MEPEEFPAEPFHPVPDWSAAHFPAYGQPQTPRVVGAGPIKHEKDETFGMIPPSSLITFEEFTAFYQVTGLGEA